MASITSAADGTWIAGAATTWVGGIAPAEGDTAIIANTHDVEIDGNITVGADSTTAAIEVQSGGRLFVPSTVAGNYTLTCKGDIKTDATGGTIEFGTVANPIPNTRTFNLKLNYSASLSDGEFGLLIRAGGTFTCQGSKPWTSALTDPDRCLLAADAAANATSITVDGTTGWNANDRIYIAPTSRTYNQYDPTTTYAGQVSSSSGTTLNLTNFGGTGGGLLYAHSGTSPTQAEIINLTRNIVIENYDGGPGAPGNVAYVVFETTATVDVDWTEFRYLGTNAADKYGVTAKTTSGSCNLNRCSIHDGEAYGFRAEGASFNNITLQNSVLARVSTLGNSAAVYIENTSGTTWTITNNVVIAECYYGFYCKDLGGTFTYNYVAGVASYGLYMVLGSGSGIHGMTGSFNYLTANSCGGGMQVNNHEYGLYEHISLWRNVSLGLDLYNSGGIKINNITTTANGGYNITCINVCDAEIRDGTLAGDATYASPYGIVINSGSTIMHMYNTTMGVAAGAGGNARVAHSTADIIISSASGNRYFAQVFSNNVTLASATEIIMTYAMHGSFVRATKHDGTAGVAGERYWSPIGTILADTSYYATASPSAKLTPSSATYKLESGSMFVPVDSGQNPTITVKVRESASLNGNAPRLMVRRNDALGITTDTVIDTATNGPDVDTPPGTFETLSGQPGAVSADGVLEFFVDVDGTAGYCNVDAWTVTGNIA